MTWRCPNCEKLNVWWKNTCRRCGHPCKGFEPTEADALDYAQYIFEKIPAQDPTPAPLVQRQPMLPLPHVDCGCPTDNYVCMSTACPRAWRITFS